jgi:hypothetical protein
VSQSLLDKVEEVLIIEIAIDQEQVIVLEDLGLNPIWDKGFYFLVRDETINLAIRRVCVLEFRRALG